MAVAADGLVVYPRRICSTLAGAPEILLKSFFYLFTVAVQPSETIT